MPGAYPGEEIDMPDAEKHIVAAIIRDIQGRKGLGDEWSMIDDETQDGIIERWREIVKEYL
jgi:hypothetical protein